MFFFLCGWSDVECFLAIRVINIFFVLIIVHVCVQVPCFHWFFNFILPVTSRSSTLPFLLTVPLGYLWCVILLSCRNHTSCLTSFHQWYTKTSSPKSISALTFHVSLTSTIPHSLAHKQHMLSTIDLYIPFLWYIFLRWNRIQSFYYSLSFIDPLFHFLIAVSIFIK